MNEITKKPVAELTTDELGQAYVDRLLADGVNAAETGNTVIADQDFFDNLRQHVQMIAAQTSN